MPAEFDNYAEQYSTLLADPFRDRFAGHSFFYERKLMLIREFFQRHGLDTKRNSWVDIGCGQGDLLKLGMADFGSSSGCDVSPAMLDGCEGLQVVRQEKDDALPFPDGFADFATAVCVYHHVPPSKRAALAAEAARILKPGGTLCIIEHNPFNPVTQLIIKRCPVDADARLLRAGEAARLMCSAGLEVLQTVYFLFCPERLFQSIGGIESYLRSCPLGGQYAVFGRKHGSAAHDPGSW